MRLALPFLDADDYHSAEAVHKLAAGTPLVDDDRWPWLERVAHAARAQAEATPKQTVVVACSALKKRYRDALRATPHARFVFVYLQLAPALLLERLEHRHGHFMKPGMLQSQIDALEAPSDEEHDTLTVEIRAGMGPDAVVRAAEDALHWQQVCLNEV